MDCETKYPIMMVHGLAFRDRKHICYWGRIPAALRAQGATIFFGRQDGWGTIEYNAGVLKDNINWILSETGCEKINLIAHSKGGLDARCMISSCDMGDKIASLTTISTPHHGCVTISRLCRLPKWIFRVIAVFTNSLFRLLGDKRPDFFTATMQLRKEFMDGFNEQNPDASEVYYQSYAGVMKNSFSDILLSFPHFVVFRVEGENDGLVTLASAEWTNFKGVLRGATRRGISHADEIDARRRNYTKKISDSGISDIREFYIDVVSGLKRMGL